MTLFSPNKLLMQLQVGDREATLMSLSMPMSLSTLEWLPTIIAKSQVTGPDHTVQCTEYDCSMQ